MYQIREAKPTDLKEIVDFCKRVHKDSRYSYIPVHDRTLTNTVQRVLNHTHGIIWLAEVDQVIEGALIGIANQLWFSRKKEAVDLFFYVSPLAKGAGAVLIRRYLTWARMTPGIVRVMIGITSGEDAEKTGKFFEAMGASQVGGMYVVDVSGDQDEQHSQEHRKGG